MAKQRQQEKAEKASKPFCFSKLLVKWPWMVLLVAFLCIMMMFGLILGLGVFKVTETAERGYLVWGADIVQKYDMGTLGEEEIRDSLFPGSTAPHSSQFQPFLTYFIYQAH